MMRSSSLMWSVVFAVVLAMMVVVAHAMPPLPTTSSKWSEAVRIYNEAHAVAHAAAAAAAAAAPAAATPATTPAVAGPASTPVNPAESFLAPSRASIVGDYYSASASLSCVGCIELTSFIAPLAESSIGIDVLKAATFAYCFAEKIDCSGTLECFELCTGIADTYVQEVVDILAERQLSPVELCADIDICPAPPMPGPRPGIPVPSNLSDTTGQRTWPSWSLTSGTGAILHLSDIHLDSKYEAGTNTDCGLPLCCRAENGEGTNANNTAGQFGDYNCDTPPALLSSFLSFVQSSASTTPDFVLYTGDDPAHDIWEQSQAANLDSMHEVVQQLQQAMTTVPVFHAVGNHEMYPVDQFLGPGGDSWLYSSLAVAWSFYLPQDAIRTLRYGGYYQTLARPGLRVISLNTNVYASGDFYTEFTNRTDFSSQFAWLDDVLVQCTELNERAIIIGHSNPHAWFTEFAQQFRALLLKHAAVIMNVFFGHSHTAELMVFHANTTATDGGTNFSQPFLTAYVGGSITPYTKLNPGFVSYSYNRSSIATAPFLVTDFTQSYFDLPTANAKGSIDWTQTQHTALAMFDLPDLSPASLSKMAQSWLVAPLSNASETTFTNYIEYYFKGNVPAGQQPGGFACDMLTTVDADDSQCSSAAIAALRAQYGADHPIEWKAPAEERCSTERAVMMMKKKKMAEEEEMKAQVQLEQVMMERSAEPSNVKETVVVSEVLYIVD